MGLSEIWQTVKILASGYEDAKKIVAFLKDRLGDNWAKILADSAAAVKILEDPNATPDQLREGARQFAALFERATPSNPPAK